MQFYYGWQMPLRLLDEAEFWKMQEKEHTVVIREALRQLEPEYVNALKRWEQMLSNTHQNIVSYIETVVRNPYPYVPLQADVVRLISYCLDESMAFIALCRQLKAESEAAKDRCHRTNRSGPHHSGVGVFHRHRAYHFVPGLSTCIQYPRMTYKDATRMMLRTLTPTDRSEWKK